MASSGAFLFCWACRAVERRSAWTWSPLQQECRAEGNLESSVLIDAPLTDEARMGALSQESVDLHGLTASSRRCIVNHDQQKLRVCTQHQLMYLANKQYITNQA